MLRLDAHACEPLEEPVAVVGAESDSAHPHAFCRRPEGDRRAGGHSEPCFTEEVGIGDAPHRGRARVTRKTRSIPATVVTPIMGDSFSRASGSKSEAPM